jgi:fumarate hydratase class II
MPSEGYRTEHDSMGEVRVPMDAKWGAQTERAVHNFPISGMRVDPALVRALARVKGMAAIVNERLRLVPKDIAIAIAAAAAEVADGQWADQFPVDVFQTGSGTSTNMNMNEVLATLASERLGGLPVHPNDHVNACQSSNDVFPTAVHLACALELRRDLVPALEVLAASLRRKAKRFAKVVKAGRTHLMDATPVTLGQEFSGYASQVERGIERIEAVLPRVAELPLGGTAVGTGLNAPKGWAKAVIERLAAATELPLTEARDHFEAQGARDALVEASGALRAVAVSLYKVSNDLRWMASGPNCGLAEIHLPDLQPGSSIMPGKVNPVVPEAVCQVVAQVTGNDAAVAFGGGAGNFELNVMVPVIGRNILESVRLLASASRALATKCVDGIEADVERCERYALASPAIVTALNPLIGYERAAEVVKTAQASGRDVRGVVVAEGLLTAEEAEQALDPLAMTRGGLRRG